MTHKAVTQGVSSKIDLWRECIIANIFSQPVSPFLFQTMFFFIHCENLHKVNNCLFYSSMSFDSCQQLCNRHHNRYYRIVPLPSKITLLLLCSQPLATTLLSSISSSFAFSGILYKWNYIAYSV